MNKIEVAVLEDHSINSTGTMMFLANLTQHSHEAKSAGELVAKYNECLAKKFKSAKAIANMEHGTIKRNSPISVIIWGGSRRLLAQLRTPQVGLNFVSGSLQYSDYSDDAMFTVPYEILQSAEDTKSYLANCKADLQEYKELIAKGYSNDTAGYKMPQALRNVLYISGNAQAWQNFISVRTCRRNTTETQYVMSLIWDALLQTKCGDIFFDKCGPDCCTKWGCQEGRMCCGKPYKITSSRNMAKEFIKENWPDLC